MFAYGLSGSGKTFTTFGIDDPNVPEAWYKWAEPTQDWGVYPRLAYELFESSEKTWKFTMKYFQNVVDIVRDLMSPSGEEKNFKAGMRKDKDGFMDIQWCLSANLLSWDDLRKTFKKSNARKAISPTQFNHQSTRGHCIMTLEVNKPKADDVEMRQKGRIYVCDLAGTEPAGDIYYASYKKIKYPDGTVEHKLLGPHKDQKKTKNLRSQGVQINMSLSEMAQFFMKMARAIKKKKLKPGKSIPGCNSFFLCKYLKDIMLQARTYLFCAIRPEMSYLKYTFATLGFAKNASVIKLNPKKATTAASPGERKLMHQLEEMKAMMKMLQDKNQELEMKVSEPTLGDSAAADLQQQMIVHQKNELELQEREKKANERAKILEARVKELEKGSSTEDIAKLKHKLEEQRKAAHGLSKELAEKKAQNNEAFKASGVDEALIEKKREIEQAIAQKQTEMMAQFEKENAAKHAQTKAMEQQRKEYAKLGIHLTAYKGKSKHPHFVNIDRDPFRSRRFMFFVKSDGDTVFGMAGDVRIFNLHQPKHFVVTGKKGKFTITKITGEGLHNGKKMKDNVPEPLANYDRVAMGTDYMLFRIPKQIKKGMHEPRASKIIKEMEHVNRSEAEVTLKQSMRTLPSLKNDATIINSELLGLLPKLKKAKKLVNELNRKMLNFEVSIRRSTGDGKTPTVKVSVHKLDTNQIILIDPIQFTEAVSTVKNEHTRLRLALENKREYTSPVEHDPIRLFMDHTALYGTAIAFPEYLGYMLDTDDDERYVTIKSAASQRQVGKLEVVWTPLNGPDDDTRLDDEDSYIDKPEEMLGKPWTYKVEIHGASGLGLKCSRAYVQYMFNGDLFTTERIDKDTHSPVFNYSCIHHVESVTPEFLKFLSDPMNFHVYVAPYIEVRAGEQPSTSDPAVVAMIAGRQLDIPPVEKMCEDRLRKHVRVLTRQLREAKEKIGSLTQLLHDATEQVAKLKGSSHTARLLSGARAADAAVNVVHIEAEKL